MHTNREIKNHSLSLQMCNYSDAISFNKEFYLKERKLDVSKSVSVVGRAVLAFKTRSTFTSCVLRGSVLGSAVSNGMFLF